jgi:DNA-binding XRE family transcriptional regulator
MMPAKPPNPIDTHVGARVRMRRVEIDMPQQILGGHLGVTFQQIQKYEKGTTASAPRVSSKLARFWKCLSRFSLKAHPTDGKPLAATGHRMLF